MFKKRLVWFTVIVLSLAQIPAMQAQNLPPINCGDIVEVETTPNIPIAEFRVQASAGTVLNGRIEPIGTTVDIGASFYDSGDKLFWSINETTTGEEELIDVTISSSNPALVVAGIGKWATDIRRFSNAIEAYGAFTIYLGCILRDGTVINPGDSASNNEQPSQPVIPSTVSADFFGFPGVAPRDFSSGIELPLTLAQPQTAPVASDVALYTYTATANEIRALKISRVSGDISIGVAVINKDTNEIVFFGGMPSSNTVSVELIFPSDGTYVIGLFRVDTAEKTGTSGAVQITLE